MAFFPPSLQFEMAFVSPFVSAYLYTLLVVKGQGLSLKQEWASNDCSG